MSRDALHARALGHTRGLLVVAALAAAYPGDARAQACLEPLQVLPAGQLTLDGPGGKQILAFLRFRVADFLVDGFETLSSAAYVTGRSEGGRPYHVWSLTAYPESFATDLPLTICGEDLLEAMDAYRRLGNNDDPMAGATAALSPNQHAIGALLRRDRDKSLSPEELSEEEAARATIAAFEAHLPERTGAVLVNFRFEPQPIGLLMQRTDIDDAMKARLMAEAASFDAAAVSADPKLLECPCAMSVMEAHVFGQGGIPFFGESLSWGTADARRTSFALTLTTVAPNADGSWNIEGEMEGGLFATRPDPSGPTPLSLATGIPDTIKEKEPLPVRARFRAEHVLPGNLSSLPKVF